MLELRVLRGLHRGAALPLRSETITVGSDMSCDIVLLDSGIAPRHVRIAFEANRWLFIAEDGEVLQIEHEQLVTHAEAGFHALANLSGSDVYLCIVDEESDWISESDLAALPVSNRKTQSAGSTSGSGSGSGSSSAAVPDKPFRRRSKALFFAASLWIVAVAFALTGFLWNRPALVAATKKPTESERKSRLDPASAPAANASMPTQAEILEATAKMIRRDDLNSVVTYQLLDGTLQFRGELSVEERIRFEHTVTSLNTAWRGEVPIKAMTTSVSTAAPFRITQVLYAKIPSVMIDSGERVFIGQSIHGYRLVSVDAGKIVFDGKRRLEIKP